MNELSLADIRAARRRIEPYVLRTPTLRRERPEGSLLLKPECLQATGAFKLRGAFSLMTTLPADCKGVVAHSSGNHAQAVARAARVLGLRAVVVMPRDAPALKRARTEADGATVVEVGPDSDERERTAQRIAEQEGLVLVPPFDHPLICAGQGTAALELLEDVGSLDRFYCPVSGGGLMAGCAIALAELCPSAEIVGVEPEDGDDTRQSLRRGERVKVAPPKSIADGLRVRTPGAFTFPIVKRLVSRIELVSDEEMLDAICFALSELRIVLEPSGAAALALALREARGRCGVLLSGGNLDPALFARCIERSAAVGEPGP